MQSLRGLEEALDGDCGKEDRSLAQVCEIFFRDGALSYKEEGPKFFQRLLSRPKKNSDRS